MVLVPVLVVLILIILGTSIGCSSSSIRNSSSGRGGSGNGGGGSEWLRRGEGMGPDIPYLLGLWKPMLRIYRIIIAKIQHL